MTGAPGSSFWHGKRVLITGHTGFKGSWLTIWLHRLGAEVIGLGLDPHTEPSLFVEAGVTDLCTDVRGDVRDLAVVRETITNAQPDVVLHLAAQALVGAGFADPLRTFETNTAGTLNVLEAVRGEPSVRVVVVITTDKVYDTESDVQNRRFLEADPLGGSDPYSASKVAAESITRSYREAFLGPSGVGVGTARAGNVLGGGDWSPDRLIPDAVRAWSEGRPMSVRRPDAVRPWQHVLEPLFGYLVLAERLWSETGDAAVYNFGPGSDAVVPVSTVLDLAANEYRGDAGVTTADSSDYPETAWLGLDSSAASSLLGVRGRWTVAETVARTVRWYCDHRDGGDAYALCAADIDKFEAACLDDR